jgi:hypothetical protein
MLVELYPKGRFFRVGELSKLNPGRIVLLGGPDKKIGCVAVPNELTFVAKVNKYYFMTTGKEEGLLPSQIALLERASSAFFVSGERLLAELGCNFPQFNNSEALLLQNHEAAVVCAEHEKIKISKLNVLRRLYSISLLGNRDESIGN